MPLFITEYVTSRQSIVDCGRVTWRGVDSTLQRGLSPIVSPQSETDEGRKTCLHRSRTPSSLSLFYINILFVLSHQIPAIIDYHQLFRSPFLILILLFRRNTRLIQDDTKVTANNLL